MQFDNELIRSSLRAFDFKSLFNELGWDHHSARHQIPSDGETFTLSAVAHKRGVQIFECAAGGDGEIPEYAKRRKIDKQVSKLAHEHLTIFINRTKTEQIWQWVSKDPGQPARYHEQRYHVGQSGEALLQKLEYLTFPLSAEESLTISGVTIRLRDAFQRERVTRRFYDRFKDEHKAFLKFLEGIPDKEMERWYVSVMINRIMFIYFVQKKGFLNGDPDYLKHKLADSEKKGKDRFYRQFLCPLFFEGFARKESERSATTNELLGDVPYFNGGLFLKHQIEELHGKQIQIADGAFEKLFEFFDQYEWHLDERPLRDDREINPDVLGYIFEKYINQKQMGAYYSKEDITGYISKNAVLPFLFDLARKNCRIAFEGETSVWLLLQADPDRYIYRPLRHGVTWDVHKDKPLDAPLSLPGEIENGVDTTRPNLLERRKAWNRPAPPEFALPTEIWREVVARRQRYEEVRAKLAAGEVRDINDLITYNLNIIQFVQDVIENCEGPELLRAFWHVIVGRIPEKSNEKFQAGVSIMDPACGSGAFLFAALNILEPLYEACLVRMEAFLGDLERSGKNHRPEKFADFRHVLERVSQHPNRRYFILKSMIVNNLFGVDIMEEAVEICKLRLFLKLVAQVERAEQIEPLPDIDFNIRAGNTLVGYATLNDVRNAVTSKLAFDDTLERIEERAEDLDRLSNRFRQQQVELGGEVTATDKAQLRDRLRDLEEELNGYLAGEYGVRTSDAKSYKRWVNSHKPFHWFIEFHGTMKYGGFDVIVGNPPWVEFHKVQSQYTPKNLSTFECKNLWAYFVERAYSLATASSRVGLIVPMSLVCTQRMIPAQQIVKNYGLSWLSNFESDSNPGQLFDGVKQNVTVLLSSRATVNEIHVTRLIRFFQEFRDVVFSAVEFAKHDREDLVAFGFPKVSSNRELEILSKLFVQPRLGVEITRTGTSPILVHRIAHYYIKCFNFVPYFRSDRDGVKKSEDYKEYFFNPPVDQFVSVINSSTFYFYWQVFFDAFKAGKLCVESFPFAPRRSSDTQKRLQAIAANLMHDLKSKATRLRAEYGATGRVEYDQFYPRNSKHVIDEVDRVLAPHYGFTEEELDFIINYDIKYRIGMPSEQEDEE